MLKPLAIKEDDLDMSGMQCRWDKVKPPENFDEVVSLLVIARNGNQQSVVFKKVIDKLDEIYGEHERRKPISVSKLKLKVTLKKIGAEMRAKLGSYNAFYLFRTWFTTMLGSFYFRTKKGKIDVGETEIEEDIPEGPCLVVGNHNAMTGIPASIAFWTDGRMAFGSWALMTMTLTPEAISDSTFAAWVSGESLASLPM